MLGLHASIAQGTCDRTYGGFCCSSGARHHQEGGSLEDIRGDDGSWHPEWLPFFQSTYSDLICLDTKFGEVLEWFKCEPRASRPASRRRYRQPIVGPELSRAKKGEELAREPRLFVASGTSMETFHIRRQLRCSLVHDRLQRASACAGFNFFVPASG